MSLNHDQRATPGVRRTSIGGHGIADTPRQPRYLVLVEDAYDEWTKANARARAAHYEMTTCLCGNPVDPLPSRVRRSCEGCKSVRAKALQRAADQRRYRERKKGKV